MKKGNGYPASQGSISGWQLPIKSPYAQFKYGTLKYYITSPRILTLHTAVFAPNYFTPSLNPAPKLFFFHFVCSPFTYLFTSFVYYQFVYQIQK